MINAEEFLKYAVARLEYLAIPDEALMEKSSNRLLMPIIRVGGKHVGQAKQLMGMMDDAAMLSKNNKLIRDFAKNVPEFGKGIGFNAETGKFAASPEQLRANIRSLRFDGGPKLTSYRSPDGKRFYDDLAVTKDRIRNDKAFANGVNGQAGTGDVSRYTPEGDAAILPAGQTHSRLSGNSTLVNGARADASMTSASGKPIPTTADGAIDVHDPATRMTTLNTETGEIMSPTRIRSSFDIPDTLTAGSYELKAPVNAKTMTASPTAKPQAQAKPQPDTLGAGGSNSKWPSVLGGAAGGALAGGIPSYFIGSNNGYKDGNNLGRIEGGMLMQNAFNQHANSLGLMNRLGFALTGDPSSILPQLSPEQIAQLIASLTNGR